MSNKTKSPAFQFYPKDYIIDENVALMSLAQEGIYTRLMSYCWLEGSIPADPELCAKLIGKNASVGDVETVQKCFHKRAQNPTRLFHLRLDKERRKQRDFNIKCSKGGVSSGQSRRNKSKVASHLLQSKREANTNSSSASTSSSAVQEDGEVQRDGIVEHCLPVGFPKTETDARACIGPIGCPEQFAADTWQKAMGRGGHDAKDIPIRNWSGYLSTEWRYEQARNVKEKLNRTASGSRPGASSVDKIQWGQERERITAKLKQIESRASSDAFGVHYTAEEKAERKKLRERDSVLKGLLGVVV